MDLKAPFEIEHKGEAVQVIPRKIGPDMVYIIHFEGRRPPMMLAKATRQAGGKFWTTIPEEREKSRQDAVLQEANLLGVLITERIREMLVLK